MTPLPQLTLQDIAGNPFDWHYDESHSGRRQATVTAADGATWLLSMEELAHIDQRLAQVVPHLFATKPTTSLSSASTCIQKSARAWLAPALLSRVPGMTWGTRLTVHTEIVSSIERSVNYPGEYRVTGTEIVVEQLDTTPVVVECGVIYTSPMGSYVDAAWVEHNFPGALHRLQIAADLGLTPAEQAQVGLYQTGASVLTVALPDGLSPIEPCSR